MLDSLRHTLCILIDRHETVLVLREGWLKTRARLLGRYLNTTPDENGVSFDALRDGLEKANLTGISVQVVLHDDAMRIWPVSLPDYASRMADLDAACAMRFEAIFDEPLGPWVWRSSPQLSSDFIACAMRRTRLKELQAILRKHSLGLASVEALSVALWNRWRQPLKAKSANAWLGICTQHEFTLCLAQQGNVIQVRHVPLSQTLLTDPLWLSQHAQREASRFGQSMPELIGLCGSVIDPWIRSATGKMRVEQLSRLSILNNLFGIAI
jgi:hypothetical protein